MSDLLNAVLLSLTSLITPLAIFIATCIYISKKVKADSVLMFSGALIALVASAISFVLIPYFMRSGSFTSSEIQKTYMAIGIVSFIGGVCFAIGFFMLVVSAIKNNKAASINFPENDLKL